MKQLLPIAFFVLAAITMLYFIIGDWEQFAKALLGVAAMSVWIFVVLKGLGFK